MEYGSMYTVDDVADCLFDLTPPGELTLLAAYVLDTTMQQVLGPDADHHTAKAYLHNAGLISGRKQETAEQDRLAHRKLIGRVWISFFETDEQAQRACSILCTLAFKVAHAAGIAMRPRLSLVGSNEPSAP
jgi:hypothetical protein